MSNNTGTLVAQTIYTPSTQDNFASHDSQLGRGGWMEVATASILTAPFVYGTSDITTAIPPDRLRVGKVAIAQDTKQIYICTAITAGVGTWQEGNIVYIFPTLAALLAAVTSAASLPAGIFSVLSAGTNGYSLFVISNGGNTLAALEGTGTFNSQAGLTAALAAGNVPNGNYRVGATVQSVVSGAAVQLNSTRSFSAATYNGNGTLATATINGVAYTFTYTNGQLTSIAGGGTTQTLTWSGTQLSSISTTP